jgi:hypothetical protein
MIDSDGQGILECLCYRSFEAEELSENQAASALGEAWRSMSSAMNLSMRRVMPW